MNYLLLICSDGIPTPEKASVVGGGIETWVSDNTARDILKCGHRLASAPPGRQSTTCNGGSTRAARSADRTTPRSGFRSIAADASLMPPGP